MCLGVEHGLDLDEFDAYPSTLMVADNEELRAWGFSPGGEIFVFATSASLYVTTRSSP
jgi:hypothetical protein